MLESNKPIIIIPSRRIEIRKIRKFKRPPSMMPPAFGYYKRYADAIIHHGGIPLICAFTNDYDYLDNIFNIANGFLFTGGEHIISQYYGCDTDPPKGQRVDPIRDSMERYLARKILISPKPTVAICRGMQLFNTVAGGTLYSDISKEYPRFNSEVLHFNANGKDDWWKLHHEIEIEPDTLLHGILKKDKIRINSLHQAAIKRLGETFRVTARCPDDQIIEAIEYSNKEKGFFIGIQGHPEMLYYEIENKWKNLFTTFINAAALCTN